MATGQFPLPEFHMFDGIRLSSVNAGIKGMNNDVTLIGVSEATTIAAVFTKNAFCAAPVIIAKAGLQKTSPRYLLINTGNANAGTGEDGIRSALNCIEALAALAEVNVAEVLPFSTGVIGEPLPYEKIMAALPGAYASLSTLKWAEAASAILTTDTRPKGISTTLALGKKIIRFNGICKGSGMINPNMATMLAYVGIDLSIGQEDLQELLSTVNQVSFNRISVDSDTSTNDAVVLMATGESDVRYEKLNDDEKDVLHCWLQQSFIDLAQLIVRDGEGATKFIEVDVQGAKGQQEAEMMAYSIAHSPLVKTALFASDPNWGRLLMAVGKVELDDFDISRVEVAINGEPLVASGEKVKSFTEEVGQRLFSCEDIKISVDLHRGNENVQVWTSDLSHEYIRINAEYRT